ncbi:hypothetical protein MHK_002621 [Candidatus Magnetomorum sp. HK-1]|nr:hypothetical protein MHK_002621 [Candidatus Magnetomorum sp. HK-1]
MTIPNIINNLKNYNHDFDYIRRKLSNAKTNRISSNFSKNQEGSSSAISQLNRDQILSTSITDTYKQQVEKDADDLNLTEKDRENFISAGVKVKQKESKFIGLLFDVKPSENNQYETFKNLVTELTESERETFLSAADHAGNNLNSFIRKSNDLTGTERSNFISAAEIAGENVGQLIQVSDQLSGTQLDDFLSQAASQKNTEELLSFLQSKTSDLKKDQLLSSGTNIGNIKISDIVYSEGNDGTITATGKADLSDFGLGNSVSVDLEIDENYKVLSASTKHSLDFKVGGEIAGKEFSGGVSIQGTAEINSKGLSIAGAASFNGFGNQMTISEGNFSVSKNADNKTSVSINAGTLSGMGIRTSVKGSITTDGTFNGTNIQLSTSASIATDLIPGFDSLQDALKKVGLQVDNTLSSAALTFNPGEGNFSVYADGFKFEVSKSDDGTNTVDILKNINKNDGTSTTITAKMIDGNYYDENAKKNVSGKYFEASLKSGFNTDFIPGFSDMESALSDLGINLDISSTDAFISFDIDRDVFSLEYNDMRFESYKNEKDERLVSFGGFSFGSGVALELTDVTFNADTKAISATVKGGLGFEIGDYGIGIDLAQADFSYSPDSGEFSLTQSQTVAGFGMTTSLTLDLSDIMAGKITVKNVSVTPETNTELARNIAKGFENALDAGSDVANNFKNTLQDLGTESQKKFANAAATAGSSINELISYTNTLSDDVKEDFLKAASKAGENLDDLISNAKVLSGNSLKNFLNTAASSKDLDNFLNKFGSIYSKLDNSSSKFSNIQVTSSGSIKANFQVPGAASTTLTFDEKSNGDLTASGSLKLGGYKFSNASFTFNESGSLKNVSGGIALKVWGVGTSANLELSNGNVQAKGSFHYGFGSISFSLNKSGLHIS